MTLKKLSTYWGSKYIDWSKQSIGYGQRTYIKKLLLGSTWKTQREDSSPCNINLSLNKAKYLLDINGIKRMGNVPYVLGQ